MPRGYFATLLRELPDFFQFVSVASVSLEWRRFLFSGSTKSAETIPRMDDSDAAALSLGIAVPQFPHPHRVTTQHSCTNDDLHDVRSVTSQLF